MNIKKKAIQNLFDIIIIGGGPAGFTAAIYTTRAGFNTLMLAGNTMQSQIIKTLNIENYPGFPDGISGYNLLEKFKEQARKYGLFLKSEDVQNVSSVEKREKQIKHFWQIKTQNNIYFTHAIINASGTSLKEIGIPGEKEYIGRGVSYCASCDALFFRERIVAVVGGGNTAIEEACFLTKFVKKVFIIHRRNELRATKIIQNRAFANCKINFLWNTVIESIEGDEQGVKFLKIKNLKNLVTKTLSVKGVFIFIGLEPNTKFLKNIPSLKFDEKNFIHVNKNMATTSPGIFACGDCTNKKFQQIITACGDGANASYTAQLYLNSLSKKKTKCEKE